MTDNTQPMAGRGGYRPNSGRKPADPRGAGRTGTVKLVEEDWGYLREMGDGNQTEGVRRLIRERRAVGCD